MFLCLFVSACRYPALSGRLFSLDPTVSTPWQRHAGGVGNRVESSDNRSSYVSNFRCILSKTLITYRSTGLTIYRVVSKFPIYPVYRNFDISYRIESSDISKYRNFDISYRTCFAPPHNPWHPPPPLCVLCRHLSESFKYTGIGYRDCTLVSYRFFVVVSNADIERKLQIYPPSRSYISICFFVISVSHRRRLSFYIKHAMQIMETSEAEVLEIEKDRKIIYAIQPHGVMSIAGICAAINLVSRHRRYCFHASTGSSISPFDDLDISRQMDLLPIFA